MESWSVLVKYQMFRDDQETVELRIMIWVILLIFRINNDIEEVNYDNNNDHKWFL